MMAVILGVTMLCGCAKNAPSSVSEASSLHNQSQPTDASTDTDPLSLDDLVGSWESVDKIPSIPNSTGLLQMRFTNDGAFDFLWKIGIEDEGYTSIIHGSYTFDGEYIRYEAVDFMRRVLYADSAIWGRTGVLTVEAIENAGLRIRWKEGEFTSQRSFDFYPVADEDVPDYFALYPNFDPYPGTVIQGGGENTELEIYSWNPSRYPGKIILSAEDQELIAQGIIDISNRYASGEWPVEDGQPMPAWPEDAPFLQSAAPNDLEYSTVGRDLEGPAPPLQATIRLNNTWKMVCGIDVTPGGEGLYRINKESVGVWFDYFENADGEIFRGLGSV